jgi:hypothetical protein
MVVFHPVRQSTPIDSSKQGKAKHQSKPSKAKPSKARQTQQTTGKAKPPPGQGKPKNDRQSLSLVSDTKKAKQAQQG